MRLPRRKRDRSVPVCILGVIDYGYGCIEANRETYDESVLCPAAVERRVRDARLHQCQCGGFHGPVPQWVRDTLRDRPGPGLRYPYLGGRREDEKGPGAAG